MEDFDVFLGVWLEAERHGDADATASLLTEDFVGIGPMGFELPKTAWVERFSSRNLVYEDLSLDEQATRFYGNCAVTTARWNAKGTAGGHRIPEAARLTLFAVHDDEWRVAGIHYSFIAGTAGAPPLVRS